MAVRDVVLYLENEAALREKSKPVGSAVLPRRVKRLVRDLKDTLNDHPEGIGLAAPQINVHSRVVVVRLGGGRDSESEPGPPLPLINPEAVEAGNEEKDFDGCLSFPGLYGETVRPHYLRVTGLDEACREHRGFIPGARGRKWRAGACAAVSGDTMMDTHRHFRKREATPPTGRSYTPVLDLKPA